MFSSFTQLKQQALDAVSYLDADEAQNIAKELEFQMENLSGMANNEKEIGELSVLLTRLKLLALPLLRDEEVNRLMRERAVEMLTDPDLDARERVETRQLVAPSLLRFETVNQPIMEALHQNQETIGDKKIFVPSRPEAVEPTVENWLLDYDQTFGTGQQKDLVWLEYVNTGKNPIHLEAKDKDTLRKLLKFYEFLKLEYAGET